VITLNGNQVRVTDAVLRDRLATVEWPDGRVRVVSMFALRGSKGGDLEVAMVCKGVEGARERMERAEAARVRRNEHGKRYGVSGEALRAEALGGTTNERSEQ